jgi:hypothetical protein
MDAAYAYACVLGRPTRLQANLETFFIKLEHDPRQDHIDKFSTTVEPYIFSETQPTSRFQRRVDHGW